MEKERKIRIISVAALIITIICLTVAFAALSQTLTINGAATLDAASWGIKFENLSDGEITGDATINDRAVIADDLVTINNIDVSLSTPGDSVTYTVDLVNEGTINAEIYSIETPTLTEEQERYISFKVTYDNGEEVKQGDILNSGTTKNLTIKIEFKKDITEEDLPKEAQEISLSYGLTFIQTDKKETETTTPPESNNCTNFEKKATYNVGDVIAICNNDTGISEDFYVISDNGSTVTALAKYNLLVGKNITVDLDNYQVQSISDISEGDSGYGLQNSLALGFSMTNPNTVGAIIFETNENNIGYWVDDSRKLKPEYGENYPVFVFDSNSNLYNPLKNYENYLRNTLGKTSVTATLLTYEQAVSLGCDKESMTCSNAPSWVKSTSYWTGSASANNTVWVIEAYESIGAFGNANSDDINFSNAANAAGLRPVITISKSEL